MALDLQAPAGAIGQVQVQHIELDSRKGVYLLEDKILVPEMAGDVQHRSPPREARIIDNHPAREGPFQLGQRRLGAIDAFGRIGLDAHPPGCDGQAIGLLSRELREECAPFGKGPFAHGGFDHLYVGGTFLLLKRNGRREHSQRHEKAQQRFHQISPP